MRSISLAIALALAVPGTAAADPKLDDTAESLSLPDLFAAAVRVAPALETATFSYAQADARFTAARGAFDVVVGGSADYQRSTGAPIVAGFPGERSTAATYALSIKKLLPTNGVLELIGLAYIAHNDLTGAPYDEYTSQVKLRLTQPLLKGVGPAGADRVYEAARLHRSAALIRRTAAARAFAYQIVTAYWELALAWRTLEIRRDSVELAKKQVAFVEGGIRTGKYSDSELLPAKQALATRQQDVLAAQLDVVDRSIALRRGIGLEVKAEHLAIAPAKLPPPAPVPLDAKALIAKALVENADLQAAVAEEQSGQAALAGSRRDLLPRADLRVEGGPLGSDVTATDAMGNITHRPTFGGGVDRLRDGYFFGANLTVEVPLGNHAAAGAFDNDRAIARDLAFQVGKTRGDVTSEVARTVYAIQAHAEAAQLGTGAVDVARANVDAEQKKFEIGKSTSAEIIRRQDELQAVRLREATEQVSYLAALAELDAATGAILGKYGVKLRDSD